ncbi:MAG TPA: rhomboid family intramembrane serine protease, partial [Longimicrobiales bacterium]
MANIAVFVLTLALPQLQLALAFVPAWVLLRPWTVVTYMFVHAGFLHILLNMLGLYFFGPVLEARLGARHFLALYFLSGIAGAVLTFGFFLLGAVGGVLPEVLARNSAVVGASGAVMGVTAAYARYWPHDRIYFWGVLPVSAWMFVLGLVALSIFSGFTGSKSGVADWAHLGGLAAGYLYALAYDRHRRKAWPLAQKRERVSRGDARASAERWSRISLEQLHEVNRPEVERLLEKARQ